MAPPAARVQYERLCKVTLEDERLNKSRDQMAGAFVQELPKHNRIV